MPGQSGMIVATFISSSTTAAAVKPSWMSNARIADQTASSCSIHPTHWPRIASAAAPGLRMTPRPRRAMVTIRFTEPMPSIRVLP